MGVCELQASCTDGDSAVNIALCPKLVLQQPCLLHYEQPSKCHALGMDKFLKKKKKANYGIHFCGDWIVVDGGWKRSKKSLL